jgi:hypothetical protein
MPIGDIQLYANFHLSSQRPLDDKTVVETIVERDTIETVGRYDLMRVDVLEDKKYYQLRLGTTSEDLADNGNWVLVTNDSNFDSKRATKRAGIPSVTVGGETVNEFLEGYFFPFVPATIAIGGNELYEVGDIRDIVIVGSTTTNEETVFSNGHILSPAQSAVILYTFGTAVSVNYTDVGVNDSLLPPLGGGTDVHKRKTYSLEQTTGNNGTPIKIVSGTKNVEFVYPYLWGMDAALLTGSNIYSLKQAPSKYGTKAVTLNGINKRIYFAYPIGYPDLTSIKDQNGFEQIGTFTKTTMLVDSSGLDVNWNTQYKVYYTEITTANSAIFTFKY